MAVLPSDAHVPSDRKELVWFPHSPLQLEVIKDQLELSSIEVAWSLVNLINTEMTEMTEISNHIDDESNLYYLTPKEQLSGLNDPEMIEAAERNQTRWNIILDELEKKGYLKRYFWGNPPREYSVLNQKAILHKLLWNDDKWNEYVFSKKDCERFKKEDTKRLRGEDKEKQKLIEYLRTLPYQKYLKTQHWKLIRQHTLLRAEFRCQLCYDNKLLEVHHLTYIRLGWEEPSDLIVLCNVCHSRHHNKLPKWSDR